MGGGVGVGFGGVGAGVGIGVPETQSFCPVAGEYMCVPQSALYPLPTTAIPGTAYPTIDQAPIRAQILVMHAEASFDCSSRVPEAHAVPSWTEIS